MGDKFEMIEIVSRTEERIGIEKPDGGWGERSENLSFHAAIQRGAECWGMEKSFVRCFTVSL